MRTNQQYRLGYIDARHAINLANKMPDTGNMNKLFKVKGKDYAEGFKQGLKHYAKEEGATA